MTDLPPAQAGPPGAPSRLGQPPTPEQLAQHEAEVAALAPNRPPLTPLGALATGAHGQEGIDPLGAAALDPATLEAEIAAAVERAIPLIQAELAAAGPAKGSTWNKVEHYVKLGLFSIPGLAAIVAPDLSVQGQAVLASITTLLDAVEVIWHVKGSKP